jgi:hypothetical protein
MTSVNYTERLLRASTGVASPATARRCEPGARSYFGMEVMMEKGSTAYVGLNVHKDSITVAYAIDAGDVQLLRKSGVATTDIDHMCRHLKSKARAVRFVYEAGPCGYDLHRELVQKGFECMV